MSKCDEDYQMINVDLNHFSRQIDALLRREKLDDLSGFLEYETFEEVPLFSRYQNISFLSRLTVHDRNTVLIGFALRHLDRIIQYAAKHLDVNAFSNYFAMLSIIDWDECTPEYGQILPCFWITSKATEILPCMRLVIGHSKEAKEVRTCLSDVGEESRFVVLDYAELPKHDEIFRVFVVHKDQFRVGMKGVNSG